jgi:hypothetical protein
LDEIINYERAMATLEILEITDAPLVISLEKFKQLKEILTAELLEARPILGKRPYLTQVEADDIKKTFDAINYDGMDGISVAENIKAFQLEKLFYIIDKDEDGLVSAFELNDHGVEWS